MFQIFLDDKLNNKYTELDTDDITNFTGIYSIADINNISLRRDVITRDIQLKGSVKNNVAFGYAFMINKDIDESNIADKLFYNYNPQLLVDCYIYEDNIQILKGSLRLKSIEIKDDEVIYSTTVTGKVVDFNQTIGDLQLEDLDLSDLSHEYANSSFSESWINPNSPYYYPVINYGHQFQSVSVINNLNLPNVFNIKNMRPALFVREIIKRIFAQTKYKFKINGTPEFQSYFNSLFIPDNSIGLYRNYDFTDGTKPLTLIKTLTQNSIEQVAVGGTETYMIPISLEQVVDSLDVLSVDAPFNFTPSSPKKANTVFQINREFETTALFNYEFSYKNRNGDNKPFHYTIQILERPTIDSSDNNAYNNEEGWTLIAEDSFLLPFNNFTDVTKAGSIKIPNKVFKPQTQISFRIVERIENASGSELSQNNFTLNFYKADFLLPSMTDTKLKTGVILGDSIIPALPKGVKQLDFLQSIRNLFNLYITIDSDTDTISFEPYDSFYFKCENPPQYAVDWSNKVDLSQNRVMKTNLDIPKLYQYTFRADNDFINDSFQKKWNTNYGNYEAVDSKGLTEKKTVEVIFSSTPLVAISPTQNGTNFNLEIPWIYKVENDLMVPTTSNIRILSKSGNSGKPINIIQENFNGASTSLSLSKLDNVPMNSNFYYDENNNPIYDIHFAEAKQIYYNKDYRYKYVRNGFSWYNRQIQELQNPNVIYLSLEVYLTPEDVNRLDFGVPIFIDFGSTGYAYFRLLKVEYTDSLSTSTVELQKIIDIRDNIPTQPCTLYNLTNTGNMRMDVNYVTCEGVNTTISLNVNQNFILYSRIRPMAPAAVIIS